MSNLQSLEVFETSAINWYQLLHLPYIAVGLGLNRVDGTVDDECYPDVHTVSVKINRDLVFL